MDDVKCSYLNGFRLVSKPSLQSKRIRYAATLRAREAWLPFYTAGALFVAIGLSVAALFCSDFKAPFMTKHSALTSPQSENLSVYMPTTPRATYLGATESTAQIRASEVQGIARKPERFVF